MTDGTCYRIVFEHFEGGGLNQIYQPEKIWRVIVNIPNGNIARIIVRYYDNWEAVEELIKQSNPHKEVLAYSELTSTTVKVLSANRN